MHKLKLGVIFGGISTEHEVSIISGTSVIKNLDKEKYEIFPIYISKEGIWYKYLKPVDKIEILEIGEKIEEKEEIKNIIEILKQLDVVFPVLHGLGGEDGSIQGLFELLKLKYVGCKILGSSIGMDKVYTKIIFEKAKINQAKYLYIRKNGDKYIYVDEEFNEKICDIDEITKQADESLNLPVFVKPSNSGSSVGIKKANIIEELKDAIIFAAKYDNKVLIEENINGREIECAVLGNEEVYATCVGEIMPADNFYSYNAKYQNGDSKVIIPANISKEKENEIKKLAIKAFKAIDGKGLSRVDFFIENQTNKIYINEINTMPGFTNISMYPKLWENCGLEYSKLLEKLIQLALNK